MTEQEKRFVDAAFEIAFPLREEGRNDWCENVKCGMTGSCEECEELTNGTQCTECKLTPCRCGE